MKEALLLGLNVRVMRRIHTRRSQNICFKAHSFFLPYFEPLFVSRLSALLYSDRDVTPSVILSLRPSVREIFLAWLGREGRPVARSLTALCKGSGKKLFASDGVKTKVRWRERGGRSFSKDIFLDIIYAMGKENVMK